MSWIDTLLGPGEGAPADPCDETVINGAPYDARTAIPGEAAKAAAPVDRLDAQIAEDIKRRQIALAVQYVAKVRAR